MQAYRPKSGVDLGDGVQLRIFFEGLRGWLESERATHVEPWKQLARFLLPRHQRFTWSDTNRGERRDQHIVDNSGTMAVRTVTAGLVSGTCSPTRTWFNFKAYHPGDKNINDRRSVKIYCEKVSDVVRAALLRSNWYTNAFDTYRNEAVFGTAAFSILEDPETDVRCYQWPIGSYYMASDYTGRVALFMRVYQKTVVQMVQEFGIDHVSAAVRSLYNSPNGPTREQWFPVVQVIARDRYFGEAHDKGQWLSFWYEMGPYNTDGTKAENGMLRRGRFDECPVMAPRWDLIGEDVYGIGPGHDALGDVMGLQATSMMVTKAVDKMVDPPVIAHPSIRGKVNILPGDTTYADTREGQVGLRPAYQVQFNVEHGMKREAEIRHRIDEAFYKNIFMMHSDSDRRDITAEEIRARDEEKMTVLGPVLGRSNNEFLEPGLRRIAAILNRRGKLPDVPEELRNGARFSIEFDSLLSQAQKMLGMGNIERFMAGVTQTAQFDQSILRDVVDLEATARKSADLLAVPANLIRSPEVVAQRQQASDRAQQEAAQADNAQKLSAAAKNLSGASTSGPNALSDLIHSTTGAGP